MAVEMPILRHSVQKLFERKPQEHQTKRCELTKYPIPRLRTRSGNYAAPANGRAEHG
jgi:hypothetical protein